MKYGFPWGPVTFVAGMITVIGVVIWLVVSLEGDYDRRCHERGGHVITVRSSTVCVDEDDRIILI